MNSADYLLQNVVNTDTFIFDDEGIKTYGDLKSAAARLAGELRALDLQLGDRVGLLAQNSLFWVAAYLAIMKLGLVAVPFSAVTTVEETGKNALWVDCKAVFVEKRRASKFNAAFRTDASLISDDVLGSEGCSAWPRTAQAFDPNRDASLMFTSGTTARPKAVRVTHSNIKANTDSIISYLELNSSDCMMAILPFYYCFGTSLLHTHMRVGGRLALSNTFAFPETTLDMMESTHCTGFAGVPSSFQSLLRLSSFSRKPLPHLRLIQQAGGKLQDTLIAELLKVKPNVKLYVMYGQTEATARLSYVPPEMLKQKIGSIGRGIPGVELRVIGDNGLPVKPGEVGEIVARGDSISPGYFNDVKATTAKFVNGLLHTGDLASVDEDGYIYILDRVDDFIKSWGHRVSSQVIESCLLQLPVIVSAAVVGVPDIVAGEAIHAFVVVRPDVQITTWQVLSHCRTSLASHMVPKAITILAEMPMNSSGKIIKAELRKMASA